MADERPAFLVTGASGFIGRHLTQSLSAMRPDWTIVAQHSPRSPLALPPSSNVLPLAATLSNLAAVHDEGRLPRRYEGVFHLAAYIPKASGAEDEAAVVGSNIVGLGELLGAIAGRADRLVFASTIDVYGIPNAVISEDTPVNPQTLYAASKIFGEVAVRRWASQTGARTAVLRVGHTYGPGEQAFRKLIPNTIRALLAGQPAVQYGEGAEKRDFLYVADAAAALFEAWRSIETRSLGTLNLVSGSSVTVADVIATLGRLVGDGAKVERRSASAMAASFEFDTERLRGALHFPRTPLEQGLRAEIESFRSHAGGS